MTIASRRPQVAAPVTVFREDIAGLRAVAVVAVTLFHFAVPGFAGGFIGVDIFFVISGFLMTSIISSRIKTRSFSMRNFYASRVLKIYPPMLALLSVLLCLGFWFLSPDEYDMLGKHAIAAVFSVANFVFNSELDYFAPARESNWLLHLWSLSVEVQFYLLFPVLLRWLYGRWPGWSRVFIVATILTLSLAVSVAGISLYPSSAFFLLPARIWEFLAGSLGFICGDLIPPRRRTAVAWLGSCMVLVSAFAFRAGMDFPGYAAILPVLGAALVVAAPSHIPVLYNPVSGFLGKISYSLYLWHWPVWVAARHYGLEPSLLHSAELLAISVSLGAASYYCIERPSGRQHQRRPLTIGAGVATATCACVAVAGVIVLRNGLPNRAPELVRNVVERNHAAQQTVGRSQEGLCFLRPSMLPAQFAPRCFDPKRPSGSRAVMIWGDSYGEALWFGLANAVEFAEFKLPIATAASCPPLVHPPTELNPACDQVDRRVLSELVTRKPEAIILFARWQYYAANGTDMLVELESTLNELKRLGQFVVLIGPNPEWTPTLPQRLFQESFLLGGHLPSRLTDPSQGEVMALDDHLAALAGTMSVSYVSLFRALCNSSGCLTHRDDAGSNELFDYDHGHMTVRGAEWVASHLLAPLFVSALPR